MSIAISEWMLNNWTDCNCSTIPERSIIMSKSLENAEQSIKEETKSVYDEAYAYTLTPYPAWAFSSLLAVTPVVSKSYVSPRPGFSPSKLLSRAVGPQQTTIAKQLRVGPSLASIGVFGAATALGGYMTYDGDKINGAGFTMAWSTLYLLVNGKNSLGALKYAKPWPVLLSVAALTNATLYGKRFIWRN